MRCLLAEDVIPSTTVQPSRVIPQFIQNLLHLERCRDGLDQDSRPDRSVGESNVSGGKGEDIVPQPVRAVSQRVSDWNSYSQRGMNGLIGSPSFQVVLHLGQVKVRPAAPLDQLVSVVEEVESEIEHGSGQGFSIDLNSGFVQVPSSWTMIARKDEARSR
jgi:hypothetical protein